MRTITVKKTLAVTPEQAFDILADHRGYAKFRGIRSAELTKLGTQEPNGVGAVRKLDVGGIWFLEEITVFERPRLIEYRIVGSRLPIKHQLGRITLTPAAAGVDIVWTSTFEIPLPFIGRAATYFAAGQMSKAFAGMLRATEKRCSEPFKS